MLSFIRKHPIGVAAGAAVALTALAWLAFGFFGVHTLFIDDVVDEAGPVFDAAPATETDDDVEATPEVTTPDDIDTNIDAEPAADPEASTEPIVDTRVAVTTPPDDAAATLEPVIEFTGAFESGAHPTAGTADVLGNGTGQRFLRFENFETDNGPDLNVYLVNSSTGEVSDFVDLGDLKGNIGDQNYEIPEDVDLDVYDEVVIWCVRFGVSFGDAILMPT